MNRAHTIITALAILLLGLLAGFAIGQKEESIANRTYRNEKRGFEFSYPPVLSLKDGEGVNVFHTIPYKNFGDCDMTGGNQQRDELVDFLINFKVVSTAVTPPYIDGNYKVGILQGTYAYEGAEGCGDIVYYFPLENNKTLVVRRAAIQALSKISTAWDYDAIANVQGVILPEESDRIFNQILSSFRPI